MRNAIGNKYEATKDEPATAIAKRIRTDIRAAVRAGDLPAELRVSVRTDRSTYHESIRMEVTAYDGPICNRVWFARKMTGEHLLLNDCNRHGVEADALLAKLTAIGDAYNYDKSEPETDYWNTRFFQTVDYALALTEDDYIAAAHDVAGWTLGVEKTAPRYDDDDLLWTVFAELPGEVIPGKPAPVKLALATTPEAADETADSLARLPQLALEGDLPW